MAHPNEAASRAAKIGDVLHIQTPSPWLTDRRCMPYCFRVSDPPNPTLPHSRLSRMLRPVLSETERTCKRDWNFGHLT
jgi:hypothetical protein